MKFGVDQTNVKKVVVWGNHSNTQYPDISYVEVEGKKVKDLINDDFITSFTKLVQNRGSEILCLRKKSSGFSAAKAICDHIFDWMHGTPSGSWVSMGVTSDGSYGIPEGLIYSMPVVCKNFEYQFVKDLVINDNSKDCLQAGIDELIAEQEEALEELE